MKTNLSLLRGGVYYVFLRESQAIFCFFFSESRCRFSVHRALRCLVPGQWWRIIGVRKIWQVFLKKISSGDILYFTPNYQAKK